VTRPLPPEGKNEKCTDIDATLTAEARALNVHEVDAIAKRPPKCGSATFESVSTDYGQEVAF
jgi:hypothetical protein